MCLRRSETTTHRECLSPVRRNPWETVAAYRARVASLTSTVAANIRGRRAVLRWTQDELAARLGWTQRVISRIEQGQRTLDLDELARLCDVMDVRLSNLVAGADEDALRKLGLR